MLKALHADYMALKSTAWGSSSARYLQGDAEDSAGMRGIHLQRNVVAVAQNALTANLRLLGPLVLPPPELVTLLSPPPPPPPMCLTDGG